MLSDVAKAAGYGLGIVTALLGKEAAMACTEAVETVIGEHYDEYVSLLVPLPRLHALHKSTARIRVVAVVAPQCAIATRRHQRAARR